MSMELLASAGNFYRDAEITWGEGRGKIQEGGRGLSLTLDKLSGSGFQSKNRASFRKVRYLAEHAQALFYLHKEQDMMRSISSSWEMSLASLTLSIPMSIHKEKETRTTDSTFGSTQLLHFTLTPLSETLTALYEWNADEWATQGGRVKTDWTLAPFTAYYRNINIDGCVVSSGTSSCKSIGSANNAKPWQTHELDGKGRNRLRWVQSRHMVYNYCADSKRFPQGFSAECKSSRF
ncbi:hypothetical protein HAX54_020559 [Datura stramonium]|uniref:Xyloglucan endo-transglycosylase C-terminal domain-containing protein n=1 Tax=Datura stramonium TaxID=4076 RepID=A0ABS8URG0_DATST|nr:hypothetical protein [Datura stramonium]